MMSLPTAVRTGPSPVPSTRGSRSDTSMCRLRIHARGKLTEAAIGARRLLQTDTNVSALRQRSGDGSHAAVVLCSHLQPANRFAAIACRTPDEPDPCPAEFHGR